MTPNWHLEEVEKVVKPFVVEVVQEMDELKP